jgi:hypothetical protein
VADIVARIKSGPSASRANYAAQLIAERLTGLVVETYTNRAMEHGTETEPEARAAYDDVSKPGLIGFDPDAFNRPRLSDLASLSL